MHLILKTFSGDYAYLSRSLPLMLDLVNVKQSCIDSHHCGAQ